MEVIENVYILEQYDEMCKRIRELRDDEFCIVVRTNPNVELDNIIRDSIFSLLEIAEKYHVETTLFENTQTETYSVTFKKKENRT